MHRLSRLHPPDKTVLNDITLAFFPGAKIGVLGYNGAGKSTLLRIMAGVDQEYRGEAALAPGATVGMLEQEPALDESKDVKGNVEDGVAETKALLDRFNELTANYSEETADEFADVQAKIEAADAWSLDTQLEYAMDALRLPPPDADVSTLSGGERRRVALCRLLLAAPDLLLLDEPTNHLDAESVAWLEQHLAEYRGAVVAVTHDRYFLDNVAGWILELDRGKGIPYQGNYSSWLEQKQVRLAQEARSEKGRERTIAAELEWVRANPKGKRTKSKARLARYEELVAEERNVKLDEVQIHIPPGPRLGAQVLTASGLSKGFGDRLLIDDLSFDLPRAGIVGVIGANGAGKTTLFRMITGDEQPDAGTVKLGDTVQLAYVDQSRDALDPAKTVWEEISEGYEQIKVGDREVNSRQYTAGFNFKGSDQQARIGTLSGGERNRVHLAKLLRSGGNLLLLDEPTNDLDVDTLARWRTRCWNSPAARSSSPTTAGSSTASPRTCSPSRATRRSPGSRATSRPTRSTAAPRSAPPPTGPTASPTSAWSVAEAPGPSATGASQPPAIDSFERDTAVTLREQSDGTHVFDAEVSGEWRAGRGPHGGYLAAMLLRALTHAVDDPARAPRSMTIHYARAPETGPVTIATTLQRAGRSLSTLSARMEQDGRLMALVLAAFSVPWTAPELSEVRMPNVQPPSSPRESPAALHKFAPPFTKHLVIQPRIGPIPFQGSGEPMSVGAWLGLRDAERPLDALALALFSDSLYSPPFIKLDGPGTSPTIDLTIHFRSARRRAARRATCASRALTRRSCTKASSRRTASSGRPTARCWRCRASWRSSCRSSAASRGLANARAPRKR